MKHIAPGITVYSGYPLADVQGTRVTFSGISGTFTPVIVSGCVDVLDIKGNSIDTEEENNTLLFYAEGGKTYYLDPLLKEK